MNELEGLRVLHYMSAAGDSQDAERSIRFQNDVLDEFSTRNKQIVLGTFEDVGITGPTVQRPAFQQMVEDIPKHDPAIQAIVVRNHSRLSRDRFESILLRHRLENMGIHVISVTEPIDYPPESRLMECIIEKMEAFNQKS